MSETNDDQMNDQVIARMRSALDELTTGVEAEALETVRPVTAAPRRRGAWLGVAAATALLATGAVWALSARSDDPVASPEETTGMPETSEPAAPTTTADATQVGANAPSFSITSARLVPGRIDTNDADPQTTPFLMSWWVTGDLQGFLFATSDVTDLPTDALLEPLDPPTGTAVLAHTNGDDPPWTRPWIQWDLGDGATWVFQTTGLLDGPEASAWIDLVFEAVPGSGLPIVLPDERASLVSFGAPSTRVRTQAFTSIDAGTADLTVTDGGSALFAFADAVEIGEVTVAGGRGWLGTYADGHVEVVWDAGGGWWGLLGISAELADEADDIVASVVRTDGSSPASTAPTPPTEQRYRTTASLIQTGDGPPMIAYGARLSNPPQGGNVELAGLDWADVPDAQTLNGTIWSGTYDLVGTYDGTVFTLTEPPRAPTGSEGPSFSSQALTPDCTDADVQPALEVLRGLDAESLGFIMSGDDRWDGRCGVFVWALFDTPELRAALAPLGDQARVEFAITPV